MKSGSNYTITFGDILILGHYDRANRRGIIEGESISLPSSYDVRGVPIVKADAVAITGSGNRETGLDLTTVEKFKTPQEAFAALVEGEREWATHPKRAALTIAGLGSYDAGIQQRTPTITRQTVLNVSYAFTCGKLTMEEPQATP